MIDHVNDVCFASKKNTQVSLDWAEKGKLAKSYICLQKKLWKEPSFQLNCTSY